MFSVIIPLYNKRETIARAVASVLAQTYSNFELIVVDDGSTDHGADIVSSIDDSRIRLLSQVNSGVSAARNAGIRAARYEYICFLDADDEYLPGYLAEMCRLIELYPDAEMWCTRYYSESKGKLFLQKINGVRDDFEGVINNYFQIASKSTPPICTGSACCSRANLLKIGGFPLYVNSGEDLITWAKICLIHAPVFSSYYGIIYHIGIPDNVLPVRIPQEKDCIGLELSDLYRKNGRVLGLRQYVAFWHKCRASCFLRLNMRREALHDTLKGLYYDPGNIKLMVYLVLAFFPYCIIIRIFDAFIAKGYSNGG